MDNILTLDDMINYEMPKCTAIPLAEIAIYKSNWGIPTLNKTKVFDSNNSTWIFKRAYKDTSREKQSEFLRKSGSIKTNKKESLSLNRMLGFLPSKKSQNSFDKSSRIRVRSNNRSSSRESKPKSSSRNRHFTFNSVQLGRVGSYLARLSNRSS